MKSKYSKLTFEQKKRLMESRLKKRIKETRLVEYNPYDKQDVAVFEPYAFNKLAAVAQYLSAVLVSVARSKNNQSDIKYKQQIKSILTRLRDINDQIEDIALEMSSIGRDESDTNEMGAPTSR